MPRLGKHPESITITADRAALKENSYPGRVIIMGLARSGDLVQAYALMGRNPDSRNREFEPVTDGIRTTAPGKSPEEMAATKDAALIYYKAMDGKSGVHVVSNGAQTEPIAKAVRGHQWLSQALIGAPTIGGVDLSSFEPDAPNHTPRITGVIDKRNGAPNPFALAVVRRDPQTDVPNRIVWSAELADLEPGVGYGIQTYLGNSAPGVPLPSFDRFPYFYPLGDGVEDIADQLWGDLNPDYRVALVVKSIGSTGLNDINYSHRS